MLLWRMWHGTGKPDPYTAKPQVVMYAYTRVGGDIADFEALKFRTS